MKRSNKLLIYRNCCQLETITGETTLKTWLRKWFVVKVTTFLRKHCTKRPFKMSLGVKKNKKISPVVLNVSFITPNLYSHNK